MYSVRDIIKKSLYYTGYYALNRLLRAPKTNRLLILMYHDLVPDDTPVGWARRGRPTVSQFAAHMRQLKRYFRVLSVEQAALEIKEKGSLDQPTAAVTFDDGYLSTYTLAYPILKQLSVPATVYLPTDWINRKMTPWWLMLHRIIDQGNVTKVESNLIEKILDQSFDWRLDELSDDSEKRLTLMAHLEPFLRDLPDDQISDLLAKLSELMSSQSPLADNIDEPISWQQANEMAQNGLSFGAHTCSHLNLRHANIRVAEKEIVDSKIEIENQLGRPITGFAYPYGTDWQAYRKLVPILERVGFDYAVTTVHGNNDPQTERQLLRRVTLPLSGSPSLIGRDLDLDYLYRNQPLS